MGSGLLNVTNVASAGGSPAQYTLTCADTTGVTANDHLGGELSNGTDAIYKILSVGSSTSLTIEDSLTEGNGSAEFGQPTTGTQLGYATPNTVLGLSKLPEGSKGWRALVERNNAIVDAAVARKVRETSGPTELTVGSISDGQYLIRSGTTIVGSAGSTPAHKDSHKSGGGDAFTSTDVLEAVSKRLQESSGPTILTMGSVADGETLRRSGSNVIGYTPASGTVLYVAQGRLSVDSSDSTAEGTSSTLYYLPFTGNQIAIYDGSSAWSYETIGSGLSFDLSAANDLDGNPVAINSAYDVFIWNDGGTKKIALEKWTSTTTRATALTLQDGVLVLTGDTGKRFVGSICTNGSGNAQSTVGKRRVSNFYNRVEYVDTTLRTSPTSYTVGASVGPQEWNAAGAGPYDEFRHVFFECQPGDVSFEAGGYVGITAIDYDAWIGLDGTTQAGHKQRISSTDNVSVFGRARLVEGLHYLAAIEQTGAGTTAINNVAPTGLGTFAGARARGSW